MVGRAERIPGRITGLKSVRIGAFFRRYHEREGIEVQYAASGTGLAFFKRENTIGSDGAGGLKRPAIPAVNLRKKKLLRKEMVGHGLHPCGSEL